MNPAHRDRIAFMRICSGKFEKGMDALIVNSDKQITPGAAPAVHGQERETVEEA